MLARTRNLGILAHVDAGKTTLTERILYATGATYKRGEVDAGTTVTDFDPQERDRGMTTFSAAVSCSWDGYQVNIINTKTTYQFTREFFLRAIVQYDSSRSRVLTDSLLSYELRPGSVFYLGYGSMIEQRAFRDNTWVLGEGAFSQSQRGFFGKVSYLFRL